MNRLQLFAAITLVFTAFTLGTIIGYSGGYEDGLRHGMEMSK